jgi:hypothetical protein
VRRLVPAAVGLVVGAVLLPGAPARADTSVPVMVVATAAFTSTSAAPAPLAAQGDLTVARSALGEQARALLALDLPVGARSATVTLRQASQTTSSYGTSSISACRVLAPWKPGVGQPLEKAPALDCTSAVPVSAAPWTFDLSPVLRAWSDGQPQLGIALVDTDSVAPAEMSLNVLAGEKVGTADIASSASPLAAMPSALPQPVPVTDPVGASSSPSVPVPARPQPAGNPASVPRVAAAPPPTAAASGVVTVQAGFIAPLPLRPAVWLLLPLVVWIFVALVRAVSVESDAA